MPALPALAHERSPPERSRGGRHASESSEVSPRSTLTWPAPDVNLACQVGACRPTGQSLGRTRAPSSMVLVLHWSARATRRVELAHCSAVARLRAQRPEDGPAGEAGTASLVGIASDALARVAPVDRLRSVEADPVGEPLCDVEVAPENARPLVDDLRQDLLAAEANVQLDSARQHRVRDTFELRGEGLPARRAAMRRSRAIRRRACRVVRADTSGNRFVSAGSMCERERSEPDQERDRRQPCRSLDDGCPQNGIASSSSPNVSRTTPSKSAGRWPSGFANSRRYMSRYDRSSSRATSAPDCSRTRRSSSQTFHSRGSVRRGASGTTEDTGLGSGSGSGTRGTGGTAPNPRRRGN